MSNLFLKKQLNELLIGVLPKQNRNDDSSKQRKFLIDCIEKQGYIKNKPSLEPLQKFFEPENFSRTYIEDPDSRLSELQRRGISSEESEFNKIKEIFETVLNRIGKDYEIVNIENVKRYALDMYKEIMKYYKRADRDLKIKSNSKGIKRGYMAMVIYYSLLNYSIYLSKEEVIEYFNGEVQQSDLYNSSKYLDIIFKNLPKINPYLFNLCGLKGQLEKETIQQINIVIEKLPEKNTKNIAAAIYYICSLPISKGGINKTKIKTKKGKLITLDLLSESCKISGSIHCIPLL